MQDRELLELAAKAYGLRGVYEETIWTHEGQTIRNTGIIATNEDGDALDAEARAWNPLADDGDALRLAVKLKLGVETSSGGCEVRFDNQRGDEGCLVQEIKEDGSMSELEATRRAIVLAAAEIGRLA